MHTLTSAFALLLPITVGSMLSPSSLHAGIALQTAMPSAAQSPRPAQPAASKQPAVTSNAITRAAAESRYRQGQVVDSTARNTNARTATPSKGPVDRGLVSRAQLESAIKREESVDPELAYLGTYGPGIGGDALGNCTVGGPVGARKCFIRFRAEESSPLVSMTFAFLSADYPGYGGGNGGQWTLKLHADDGTANHFPAGAALAIQYVNAQATSSAAKVITFSRPYPTIAGTLYHLVIENVDPLPTVNFFSVNLWVRLAFPGEGPLNPRHADSDWGAGCYNSGTWRNFSGACPIADIAYRNGAHQGMSYGEASYCCPAGAGPCTPEQLVGEINGAGKMVRERFTVTGGDQLVGGLGVRLLRNAETASDLVISLRSGSNELIESVAIPASSIAAGPGPKYAWPASWDDLGQSARWVTAAFDDLVTLSDGETYFLELSSAQGSYWAWVNRRLCAEYAYSPVTAFTDGWAEYTVNGSTWESLGRVRHQNDLQFYFTTVSTQGE